MKISLHSVTKVHSCRFFCINFRQKDEKFIYSPRTHSQHETKTGRARAIRRRKKSLPIIGNKKFREVKYAWEMMSHRERRSAVGFSSQGIVARKPMDISRPSVSRRLHNACAASVHSAPFPFALTSARRRSLSLSQERACDTLFAMLALVRRALSTAGRPGSSRETSRYRPPFVHLSGLITAVLSGISSQFPARELTRC